MEVLLNSLDQLNFSAYFLIIKTAFTSWTFPCMPFGKHQKDHSEKKSKISKEI